MSPFVAVNFPMVTDFTVEVMHTMYIGAFRRRLEGFTSGTSEGKFSTYQIKRINQRLLRFRTCRLYEFDPFVRQITALSIRHTSCVNFCIINSIWSLEESYPQMT